MISRILVLCTCQERAQQQHYEFDDAQGFLGGSEAAPQSSGLGADDFPPMIDFRGYL